MSFLFPTNARHCNFEITIYLYFDLQADFEVPLLYHFKGSYFCFGVSYNTFSMTLKQLNG